MPQYRERETGVVKSNSEVRKIHNNVSFSTVVDTYADLGWDEIVAAPQPEVSSVLKILEEDEPVEVDGKWTQVWVETDKFDNSDDSTKAEKETAYQADLDNEAAVSARQTRNAKLSESDWHGLKDKKMSAEMTAYRQELRDVPQQEGFPHEVTWPDSPQMTDAEMEAMIERAAEAGARTALREVGLSDEDANSDVKELRNLLDSFRSAKRTVGKTIVQGLTTLFLAGLMAGAYFNFTDKQ